MKCWYMKRILALPTCQKICSDKEPEQIDFRKFYLGHPVVLSDPFCLWLNMYAMEYELNDVLEEIIDECPKQKHCTATGTYIILKNKS